MNIVNILHETTFTENGLAFQFPLRYNKARLRNCGMELNFFDSHAKSKIFECDVLGVSNKYFGKTWRTDDEQIFTFLSKAREQGCKILWFDIQDSTGTTQFNVLPYVDRYLKAQILKDLHGYKRRYRSHRIFAEYYHDLFNVPVEVLNERLHDHPSDEDLEKINVSWNSGMSHYGSARKYYKKIWHSMPLFPRWYPKRWTDPSVDRGVPVSCRIGARYSRAAISRSREQVKEIMRKMGVPAEKIPREEYFAEMRNSIAAVSPFGLGEISLRDFEIVISGGAIVKQNSDHLKTWPNLFVDNETYIPIAWNLSDLDSVIDTIRSNPSEAVRIATTAQDRYKKLLTTEDGHNEFCTRFLKMCS
jgi:hypothetical protein